VLLATRSPPTPPVARRLLSPCWPARPATLCQPCALQRARPACSPHACLHALTPTLWCSGHRGQAVPGKQPKRGKVLTLGWRTHKAHHQVCGMCAHAPSKTSAAQQPQRPGACRAHSQPLCACCTQHLCSAAGATARRCQGSGPSAARCSGNIHPATTSQSRGCWTRCKMGGGGAGGVWVEGRACVLVVQACARSNTHTHTFPLPAPAPAPSGSMRS